MDIVKRRRWLWVVVPVLLLAGGLGFVFLSSPPSVTTGLHVLSGARPKLTQMYATQPVSAPSAEPAWLRFQVFEVKKRYDAVLQELVKELGDRVESSFEIKMPEGRSTTYRFWQTGEVERIGKVRVQERAGRSTIVEVSEYVDPTLSDKISDWWEGVTGTRGYAPKVE